MIGGRFLRHNSVLGYPIDSNLLVSNNKPKGLSIAESLVEVTVTKSTVDRNVPSGQSDRGRDKISLRTDGLEKIQIHSSLGPYYFQVVTDSVFRKTLDFDEF